MQSLAEQWRLQLAAQDESSGVSGAPAETLKAKPLEHISDEVASPLCKLSVVLPQDQAPGGVQEKSHLKVRLSLCVTDFCTESLLMYSTAKLLLHTLLLVYVWHE